MKKVIFGIFAHPDDEAFGPCGTLIKEASEGTDLHLITLTSGEAGQNPDNVPDLGAARDAEWRAACTLIGAASTHNLKLADGHLDNIAMQSASEIITPIICDAIDSYKEPIAVEFMTFEPNGLTGHIDHIVAARMATFVFHRLKDKGLPLTKIRYYCICEDIAPTHNTTWIYADKGYGEHEIDELVDARELSDRIIAVMRAHVSQRADCEHYLETQGGLLGLDHFILEANKASFDQGS